MRRLVDLALRNPVFVLFGALLVVAAGLVMFEGLGESRIGVGHKASLGSVAREG